MFIFYNKENGRVLDISDELTTRDLPLGSNTDYLVVPNRVIGANQLYETSKSDLSVEDGVLKNKGFSVFTFSGIKSEIRDRVLELAESKLNMFGLAQAWYLKGLIDLEDSGATLDFPYRVFNLVSGNVVTITNSTQLRNVYSQLLPTMVNHLESVITKYGTLLFNLEQAQTHSDLQQIKLWS